jgi:hypothetical protein
VDRLEPKRLVRISGLVLLVTIASSVVFCYGCTVHEESRRGPQDYITNLLALGTYFSLILAAAAVVGLVLGIILTNRNMK